MTNLKKIRDLENIFINVYIIVIFLSTFCVLINKEIFKLDVYLDFLEKWSIFYFCFFFLCDFKKKLIKNRVKNKK